MKQHICGDANVIVCCLRRDCASVQPFPHPEHHPAAAGRTVCGCRTGLQWQEQHPP